MRFIPILAILSACTNTPIDPPPDMRMSELYPDMVERLPSMGCVVDPPVRFVDTRTLGEMCWDRTVTYSACTRLPEGRVIGDMWLLDYPDDMRAVMAHELTHLCSWHAGDMDAGHVRADLWGPGGFSEVLSGSSVSDTYTK